MERISNTTHSSSCRRKTKENIFEYWMRTVLSENKLVLHKLTQEKEEYKK